ncbi:PerC family transcriptional regulator [Escherichia coli]|uniref:PerC family transcriptional regulator n=1 Tax=Escherichia coli TaxID=562 RepID=UPI003CFEC1C8
MPQRIMFRDKKAEELESKGLWRRAAQRWLELSLVIHKTESEKRYFTERYKYCLSMVNPPRREKHDFGEIKKAINETSKAMGLIRGKKRVHDGICFK